jgi:uncharacterized protein YbjT (DUF2867 family)
MVRKQATSLPDGAEVAIGGLLDLPAVAKDPDGVDKLYLLNAVVPDQLTQGLNCLRLGATYGCAT